MVDRMRDELCGVVLNLGNYESSTLPHVEVHKRDEILKTIQALREECVAALVMMNDIDHHDRDAFEGLAGGIRAIKKKAMCIIYPVKEGESMSFCFAGRRADAF